MLTTCVVVDSDADDDDSTIDQYLCVMYRGRAVRANRAPLLGVCATLAQAVAALPAAMRVPDASGTDTLATTMPGVAVAVDDDNRAARGPAHLPDMSCMQ